VIIALSTGRRARKGGEIYGRQEEQRVGVDKATAGICRHLGNLQLGSREEGSGQAGGIGKESLDGKDKKD
jgi:hypothetical protein